MLESLAVVPGGNVLLSLVSGYWGGPTAGRGLVCRQSCPLLYLSRWLDSGAIKSNDLLKITKGFSDSAGVRKLDWEN